MRARATVLGALDLAELRGGEKAQAEAWESWQRESRVERY